MAKPFYTEGNYVAEVSEQAMGKASTGNPQFILQFKILGTIDPDDPSNYVPVERQYDRRIYRAITEKSVQYLTQDLEKLGFSGSSFGQLDPVHPQHVSFVGQQIEVTCEYRPHYQTGDDQESWSLRYDGGGANKASTIDRKPLENKDIRQLDAMFGAYLPGSKTPPAGAISGTPQQVAHEIRNGPVPEQRRVATQQPTVHQPAPRRSAVAGATPQKDDWTVTQENMTITDDDIPF